MGRIIGFDQWEHLQAAYTKMVEFLESETQTKAMADSCLKDFIAAGWKYWITSFNEDQWTAYQTPAGVKWKVLDFEAAPASNSGKV